MRPERTHVGGRREPGGGARRVLRGDETNSSGEERRPVDRVFVSIKRRSHRTDERDWRLVDWWTGRCPGGAEPNERCAVARSDADLRVHTH